MSPRPLLALALAVSAAACSAERLTGTAAQDAARQYQARAVVSANDPLILIDGREVDDAALRSYPVDSIHSVSVVKGQTAVKLYGERASHGVILVVTKAAASTQLVAKPTGTN